MDYSRPGKPTDNPFIESFNGSFRDECLNVHWFLSLEDAYKKISAWVEEYNHFRPHSALNGRTPAEVVDEEETKLCRPNGERILPEASLSEAMYFAASEHQPAEPENTYLHKEFFTSSNSPNSPT